MTGPEHYAEAARILAAASEHMAEASRAGLAGDADTVEGTLRATPPMLAAAQVHATLALAAATAYPAIVAYTGDEMGAESRGWARATEPKQTVAS